MNQGKIRCIRFSVILFFCISFVGSYTVTISPSSFPIETSASVQWTAPSGHSSNDIVKWYFEQNGTQNYITSSYVSSSATSGSLSFSGSTNIPHIGSYIAKYFTYSSADVAAISNTGTATYDGFSITIPEPFSVETSATIQWTAPPGHSSSDLIKWYYISNETEEYLSSSYVSSSATSGTVTFSGPSKIPHTGSYIAKYFVYSDSSIAATSNTGTATYEGFGVVTEYLFPVETSATVKWTAPSGHSSSDLIKWYYISNGTEEYLSSSYVSSSATSGNVTFSGTSKIPHTGTYMAKYFVYSDSSIAATSNTGRATNLKFDLRINPATFSIQTSATVNWVAPSGHSSSDLIKWYYLDSGAKKYITSNYVATPATSGFVTFSGTSEISHTGSYVADYSIYSDRSVAGTSNLGICDYSGYAVSVPSSFTVDSSVTVNWEAPSGHSSNDKIKWYFVENGKEYYLESTYVSSVALSGYVTFDDTNSPGSYTAKYVVYSDASVASSSTGIASY